MIEKETGREGDWEKVCEVDKSISRLVEREMGRLIERETRRLGDGQKVCKVDGLISRE